MIDDVDFWGLLAITVFCLAAVIVFAKLMQP